MAFQGIKAGDVVEFQRYFGLSLSKGRDVSVYQAKVNPLLIFEDHVVVNYGNNGSVVNASNFIRVMPRKDAKGN